MGVLRKVRQKAWVELRVQEASKAHLADVVELSLARRGVGASCPSIRYAPRDSRHNDGRGRTAAVVDEIKQRGDIPTSSNVFNEYLAG